MYESGINGVKLVTGNLERLRGKRITVFACGATPARPQALDSVINRNFTAEQLKVLRFFYLRGGFDFSRLGARDKVLMTLLKWKLQAMKRLGRPMDADGTGMLAAYDHPLDFTKRVNIEPLVAYMGGVVD